ERSPDGPSSREEVRQRFVAAWEDTAKGGPLPTVEAFVAPFAEPERSAVRSELLALDQSYRERRSGAHPAPDAGAGTVDYQPAAPEATGEYLPDNVAETTDQAPGSAGETDGHAPAEAAVPRAVAGYEILGVLGRGAFGVVYKARQPGLKRLVALKMILAGGHADAQELARFRSEAEVVARLQHPHIVQVYEVGDDGGRPFFSLEFVDGTNLREKIAGTPQPPREAAALVQTLAGAMAYAHEHGVVHRDLKPANVLLTRDGTAKISDFGLARRLDEDSGQTRTGSAVGTPSYMAPEQAEGRSREAGPLADVYSLGATLYELLTGRAPFRGASILETLEQVRAREPVAPSQLQPALPRDLETVCLKCLHKDPARRYAGAAELAEDLRRFLAGEPIKARPVSRAERAWRWCRRNPWVAGPSAAAALVVVAWAVTSSALAWGLKLQKDATEAARGQAVTNASKASEQARIAGENEQKAEVAAEMARAKHDQGMTVMVDFVGGLYNQMQSKRLSARHDPELVRLRRDMLDQLRLRMLAAVQDMDQKGVSTFGTPRTYQQLGDLMKRLGQGGEALRLYRQGQELAARISARQPDNDIARGDTGLLLQAQGDVLLELGGDARASLTAYRQALDLHRQVLPHPRGTRGENRYSAVEIEYLLALADMGMGKAYVALGDPAAARRYFEEARKYREERTRVQPTNGDAWSYLAEAHLWLGVVAWHLGDAPGVEEHFAEAVRICENLARQNPADFSQRHDLADIYGARADAELRLGKVAEAATSCRQALQHIEAVVKHDPDDASQVPLLALTHERLAGVALRRGDRDDAARHYREALDLREELMQVEPNNLAWQAGHVLALARCGKHAEAAAAAAKLQQRAPGATEPLLQVARCYALCAALDTPRKPDYRAKALAALRAAVGEGYRDAAALETDPELAALRPDPAYRAVLAAVKARGI
ncbi:MAG TPA: protein kinase, partial [Gemmataceae bacterium]|nr:protein kinase [Gemmataceae bacterium]